MSTIANLSVSVTADIEKFQKNMTKSSSILSSFQMNCGALAGKLLDLSAASVAAGAIGLGAIVGNTIETITQQTRLADRLGLSTETMAGFSLACSKAGIEAESTNTALSHMQKAFGEALSGSTEAQATFNELGIDLVNLASQTPDERLKTLANAFKGIDSAGTKAALAQKLFGRGSAELVSVLEQGGEALDASTEKAKQMGLAISRVDAQAVIEAHRAFGELWETLKGLATTLTVELSPFITAATHELLDMGKEGGLSAESIVNAFEGVLSAIATCSDYVELLKSAFYAARMAITASILALSAPVVALGLAIEEMLNLLPGANETHVFKEFAEGMAIEVKKAADESGDAFNKFSNGENAKSVETLFAKIRADAKKTGEKIKESLDVKNKASIKDDMQKAIENGDSKGKAERLKAFEEMQKKADELGKSLRTNAEKFQDSMTDAIKLYQDNFIDDDTFKRAFEKAQKDFISAEDKGNKEKSPDAKVIDTHNINIEGLKNKNQTKQEIHSQQIDLTNQLLTKVIKAVEDSDNGLG